MSQQNNLPPPPPSPHPSGNVPGDFYSQRRRLVPAQPASIRTDFLRAHGGPSPSPTPISGGNTAFPFSPSTPVALNPRIPSGLNPASQVPQRSPSNQAMEPYNPRQWSQSRQATGSQTPFGRGSIAAPSTRAVTGMEESMPSPPPPYATESPNAAVQHVARPAPVFENLGLTTSPMPADLSGSNSPQVQSSPSFPPPPGQSSRHRDRSTSGLAGTRAFLSGLRGKQPARAEAQPSTSMHVSPSIEVRPPASRRAASTGHIQSSSAGPATLAPGPSERSSPENSWQPGMPLPGPPPGPPPPGARSQSLNRYPPSSSSRSNSQNSEDSSGHRPVQRRTMAAPGLGPVPPTPAGWVEGQDLEQLSVVAPTHIHHDSSPSFQPLRIDTGTHREASVTRRPAIRELSRQGIRERRSRSRKAKERNNDIEASLSDDTRPNDLVFSPSEGSINRRREHMRTVSGFESVPKAESSMQAQKPASATTSNILTPPYTPALKQGEVEGSRKPHRPISHLLHMPNEDSAIPAPISPARPPSASSMKSSTRLDAFYLQALERHRAFIERESAATSDEERLELFATFMVHESRVRRDRYQAAYHAMAGDIVDFTRDMWRSYTRTNKRAVTPSSTSMSSFDPTVPSWASDGQPTSAHGGIPSSASSFGEYTPATDAASLGDASEAFERAESRQWTEAFKPTLSPIPSMAQSTAQDESSSRGRTASRWWEQSNSGSGSGSIGKPERIERSHRETKYMGVKAAELQDTAEPSPPATRNSETPGVSAQTFRLDEYPPEKVGWHDGMDFDTPQATPGNHVRERKSSVSTGGHGALDVSRLVTLPPPYPRHHPAINNHHPLLSVLRNEHRELADHSAIRQIKDGFLDGDFAIRQEQNESAKERRGKLRSSVQEKVSDGTISYAEAAQAESDFGQEEAERGKANARGNFERFETHVAQPLNTLLTGRITKADECILRLKDDLTRRNHVSDPNQAQEEGDEYPERLEQLTLLKWLFEAREQLHKEMFDLHAARSEQYSEVILTPYRIQRLQAKIDEATAFFNKDSRQRQLAFAKDALKRYEDLQHTMDQNVSRGVEDQLSAFWDIAPNLMEVIVRVPEHDLAEFDVDIPPQEYEETPAYHEHPLQYLYSLLNHAGKSAYQFIESQTNLLCLLHEVRTATTKSSLRLLENDGSAARSPRTPGSPSLQAEIAQARREAEARLTEDLKEKVGEVESQWREALGESLEDCKGRVRAFLEENGGWEEGLEG